MRTEASRRGQAMIEMALGMLVFVLIVGALLSIGSIIPESMRLQSMVRRMAGYEAQCNTSGSNDGTPLPNLQYVLSEPEIQPVTTTGFFFDASTRPFEYRSQALNFSVEIEPGTADWIWGGETTFRGLEECHMPIMKIPEFGAEGGVK